ncbi:MAG: hypothetical protein P8P48_00195 [Saprospiraceae bacterium]|nr:hypothetical protein [Saprospiraceae bacterium]
MKKSLIIISLLGLCLVGCSDSQSEHTSNQEDSHNHGDSHEGHHSMGTLPVEKRVAFMSGHVEAGLALYRAGKPEQAAKHLLHPVSETHQAERAGIDSLGFKPDLFKSVSKALDAGRPASEIEPMLVEAEENITLLQKNSGGDVVELITFLMEKVDEEYNAGVSEGMIVEAGEYQDAFGFSIVALKMAKRVEGEKAASLVEEASKLVSMWPEIGPLADSKPAPVEEVVNQAKKVVEQL